MKAYQIQGFGSEGFQQANVPESGFGPIQIRGAYCGSVEMFQAMNRAIDANDIHPVIHEGFAFEDAPRAPKVIASAGHFGEIVIRT